MSLMDFFLTWRSRRAAIAREAVDLMMFLGDMAYDEARTRARACRHRKDRQGDRHWSQIAGEVAKRTGREIGVKAADRYASADRPEPIGYIHTVAIRTNAMLAILSEIAAGKGNTVSVQNLRAHVLNAVEFAKDDVSVARTGNQVSHLATQLEQEARWSTELVRQGVYPPSLHQATQAVERLRVAMLRALERRSSNASRT